MKQFLGYTGIGILSTVVEYLSYTIVLVIMGENPHAIYYGVISGFIFSVLFSYICNQRWIFKCEKEEKRNFFISLLKTYAMYFGTGIILKEILMWFFIKKIYVSKWIAPIIIVVLIYPINFYLSKFWAYKTKKII